MTPKVMELAVDKIVLAAWNYKTDGTPEKMAKLKASIERDNSVGVLPVRELANGKFEAVDGNHRLRAIKELGWKKVSVENFGKISKAEAVLLARRRNAEWFEDDVNAFNKLMAEAMKEVSIEEMAKFMPESLDELEAYKHLNDFDWNQPTPKVKADPTHHILNVKLSTKTHQAFEKQVLRIKRLLTKPEDEEAALEQVYACIAKVLKAQPDTALTKE